VPVTHIRLVAVDLDDCLFNRDGVVPDASIAALDDLANQGALWVVATGRAEGRLYEARERLHPTGGWIWAHGARATSGEWTRSATLAKLDVLAISDLLTHDFPSAVMAVDSGDMLYRDKDYPAPTWPGRRYTVADRETMALVGADMIRIHCDRIGYLSIAVEEMNLPVRIWDSGPGYYAEITASTASKLSALGMLATHLGVRDTEVAAIGDGHSDAGMLKWAAVGVSFTDAHHAAQTGADLLVDLPSSTAENRFVEALRLVTDYDRTIGDHRLY